MIKGKAFSPKAKHGTKGHGKPPSFLAIDLGAEPMNRAERRRAAKKRSKKEA